MKFQLAVDLGTVEEMLGILEKTADLIDIVEIGTPMILEYGMEPVRLVKKEFPGLIVLADTKIMDAGEHEAAIAFKAGADIATVMGVTNNETLSGAFRAAEAAGRRILVDMMCVPVLAGRAGELKDMGADYLCVHSAKDMQGRSNPYSDLVTVQEAVGSAYTAIAGGVSLEAVELLRRYKPEIVIVGGAVTGCSDVKAAAAEIRRALDS